MAVEVDTPNEAPAAPKLTGIIYPPPAIRNIIDKTAHFVAKNGLDFEVRVREKEANNPKFNFLNVNDPYNGYYVHKVNEFQTGTTDGKAPAAPSAAPAAPVPGAPAPAAITKVA
eukprot:Colp12_sorted_trinity150504_noHs@1176